MRRFHEDRMHWRFQPYVTKKWSFRLGPFFQAIFGLDQLRTKRIQGELALPLVQNLSHLEVIQHRYGHRECQRFYWIQNIPLHLEEDVFKFLVLVIMVFLNEIPQPFAGERARLFIDSLRRRLDEAKQIMGPLEASVQRREYLMKHWWLFRNIGEHLILNEKKLSDVIKAFDQRHQVFDSFVSYIVNLFL